VKILNLKIPVIQISKLDILMLIFSCLFSTIANAEQIKLKNGDTVYGKVVRRDSESVTVDIGGVEITYWQEDIQSKENRTTENNISDYNVDENDSYSSNNPKNIHYIDNSLYDEGEATNLHTDIDIIINDEIGDVSKISKCAHDIKTIYAKTAPGYLIFKAITVTNIRKCLETSNMAGAIMEVYIDADHDQSTGQNTFWGKKPGFEFHVKLLAGIDYGNQGIATEGRLNNIEPIGYFASYNVGDCKESSLCFSAVISSFDSAAINNSELGEYSISAKIPLDKLELEPGQKIRLLFRESGSKDIGEGSFSAEKSLILK